MQEYIDANPSANAHGEDGRRVPAPASYVSCQAHERLQRADTLYGYSALKIYLRLSDRQVAGVRF